MYLSFLRMVKVTSLWNQLTGCFSLNQNFIVNIAGSGRRAGRPGSVRRHVFVHVISPDNTSADCSDSRILQPRTHWCLSTVILLLRMWSSWACTLNFSMKWKKKYCQALSHVFLPPPLSLCRMEINYVDCCTLTLSSKASIWRFHVAILQSAIGKRFKRTLHVQHDYFSSLNQSHSG